GGTFSEMLTNISNSFQAIDYYFRPQLRSSRVNPNDPLSATCFGQTVPAVSIGVYPIPNAFVSGGDISANEALVCNGMANTMMTLNTNTNASPFSLGHFISGVTATNVGNPNLYALND